MSERGWIVLSDGVKEINMWRWSVIEHYTLARWHQFVRTEFPLVKGVAVGVKLFTLPGEAEVAEWGERRVAQELEGLRDALTRLAGRDVRVFVKDNEDLRREKYASQQQQKAAVAEAPKQGKGGAQKAAAPADAAGGKKGGTGDGKKGGGGGGGGKKEASADDKATIGHLDLRVGVVVSAANHPDGDTLYVEQIDVGEKVTRTIVSGIREHVPIDRFVGSRVLVMCNLKEKPLRGVNSNGMIVCGSKPIDDKTKIVRLLEIPPDAKPGTRVTWVGEAADVQPDPAPVSAAKLGKLLKELRTDAKGNVVFGASGWQATVEGHSVTCKEIPDGHVG